jgi:hypothetical protein
LAGGREGGREGMLATAGKSFKAAKKRVKDVFDDHGPKVMQIYNRPATP